MIEVVLKSIATLYYPVGVSSLRNYDEYIKTVECRNLINRLNESFLITEESGIRKNLLNAFRKNQESEKIEDFTLESFDKCLTFKIEVFEKDLFYQICVNISVLVPYYLVYVLKNGIELEPYQWTNLPERDEESEKNKFKNHLNLISDTVEKEINYNKFPDFLISDVMPNISSSDIELGGFTYFNAFFLNNLKL